MGTPYQTMRERLTKIEMKFEENILEELSSDIIYMETISTQSRALLR